MQKIPRRVSIEDMTLAERAILDAVAAVERMPADVRLTDAVVLLQAARESVADYVDGVASRRVVHSEWPR
jgi:pyridoxal biosynthesis lyase PdxS